MTLDVYGHVFEEFDPADRIAAEEQIRKAREKTVSELCPPEQTPDTETPAAGYNPSCFPRISFMISSVPPPIGPRRASRAARSTSATERPSGVDGPRM